MNWYRFSLFCEASVIPEISEQEAVDRRLFGPVWHGTSETNREKINMEGFMIPVGDARSQNISHGYEKMDYHGGVPAPVHHIGYGTYFTTNQSIAKQYGSGDKGQAYYLDVPRLETINFGAPRTMMRWWIENGYNPEVAKIDRVLATKQLTDKLSQQFDAVWFKGKGIRRLLDGDQICVFNPNGKVYQLNRKLASKGQIGSKVRRISDGMIGEIREVYGSGSQRMQFVEEMKRNNPEEAAKFYPDGLTASTGSLA